MDLCDIVGGLRHEVFDEVATLEHGDLRGFRTNAHGHEVAADGSTLALPPTTTFDGLVVELGPAPTEDRLDRLLGLLVLPAASLTLGAGGGGPSLDRSAAGALTSTSAPATAAPTS